MKARWLASGMVAAVLGACSSVDPHSLAAEEELGALSALPFAGWISSDMRVLVTLPIDARSDAGPAADEAEEDERTGPLHLDPHQLQAELARALERLLPGQGRIEVSDAPPEAAAADALARGFDLVLSSRVRRWDASFLGRNGWWFLNAATLEWFFWPIGPQWLVADEVFGVHARLEFELTSAAAERPLPGLDRREVVVRSPLQGESEALSDLDVLPSPRLDLDDFDRGVQVFHTWWTPGDLDPEQWERTGVLLEPWARRWTAIRTAAAVGQGLAKVSRMGAEERDRALRATHALLIGVSSYAEPCPAAAEDARRVMLVLTGETAGVGSQARWAPPKNVCALEDGRASRGLILTAIEELARRAAPRDLVVVEFAGRGERRAGVGLDGLVLLDAGEEGISLEELATAMRQVRARRRLIVIDADFREGPRGRGSDEPPADLERRLREAFLAPPVEAGAVVLASDLSRDSRARTWEGEGLLTRWLVRGLAGEGDEDRDGLSWGELGGYLQERVEALAAVALVGPQRPLVVTLGERDPLR